jgi:HlyD family secretion protein
MKFVEYKEIAQKKLLRRPLLLGIPAVLLILGIVWIAGGFTSSRSEASSFHQVRKNDFLISIVEGGTLRSVNDVRIRSEVEGTARIISIVSEGTYVKKGDLLVELDSADIRERLTQQEITYENSVSLFIQARENLAIQQSLKDSNLREAELKLQFAKSDLEKFIEGEYPQSTNNAVNKITLIEEELERAADKLNYTTNLFEIGYASKTELKADELTVKRKEIELAAATNEFHLLLKFDLPNREILLKSNVDQAEMELERTEQRMNAQVAQAEADLRSRKSTLNLAETKLEQLREQLDKTKIYAPQDGLVVYVLSGGPMSQSGTLIEEGATIRQRQEIIQLPDISQMLVELKVHEAHVGQVRPGQLAFVTIDALPDRRFRGRVRRVSLLPDTQARWGNPNLKVYTTEVLIEENLPNINPGVSARAEIVVTNLQNVLTVPIQAVTTRQGQQVAYLAQGSNSRPVPVELGLFNDRFIQVRSGLNEGDRVLLSPPLSGDAYDLSGSVLASAKADMLAEHNSAPPPSLAATPSPPLANGEPRPETAMPEPERSGSPREAGEGRRPPGGEGRDGQFTAADRERMRQEFMSLSPEDREARLQQMRERGGGRGGGEGRRGGPQIPAEESR